MATNTNNGNRDNQNHLLSPSTSLDGISPCPQAYCNIADWGQSGDDEWNSVPLPVLLAVFLVVVLLLRFFCARGLRTEMEEQDAGGGDEANGSWVGRSRSSMVAAGAAVEMAPPLVRAYWKADGLGTEDSCGVCLADLADGEAVRVLPACKHYFHAACVGEWLRGHDTCPLCRTPLVAPGGAT